MKFAINLILVIISIPMIMIAVLAASMHFELLNPAFWQTSFQRHNVYTNLSVDLKKTVEDENVKAGAKLGDVKVLSNIITPENLKDLIEKNLSNILGYMNGNNVTLNFYVPVSKLPHGFLPKNIESQSEQVPVTAVIKEFNVTFISASQIRSFSLIGKTVTYLLLLDCALIVLFLIFLFLLVSPGSRFVGPGFVLLLSGLLTFGLYQGGVQASFGLTQSLAQTTTSAQIIAATIIPPILNDLSLPWLFGGLILTAAGIVLFFLKKPLYNNIPEIK